jgi:hypothetical protein
MASLAGARQTQYIRERRCGAADLSPSGCEVKCLVSEVRYEGRPCWPKAPPLSCVACPLGRRATTEGFRFRMSKQRSYLAYILRLWETSNGETQIWRASLETPGSRQRSGFASLQGLMAFLEAEIESQDERHRDPDQPGEAEGQRPQWAETSGEI